MNITDRISSLSSALMERVRGKPTLPEQADALEAATAVAENPNLLSEARSRITQLESELTETRAKVADTEERVNALVEERIASERAQMRALSQENERLKSEAKTAEQRAIEIAASCGVTAPAAADTSKGASAESKPALTGIAAVRAMYAEKYRG